MTLTSTGRTPYKGPEVLVWDRTMVLSKYFQSVLYCAVVTIEVRYMEVHFE